MLKIPKKIKRAQMMMYIFRQNQNRSDSSKKQSPPKEKLQLFFTEEQNFRKPCVVHDNRGKRYSKVELDLFPPWDGRLEDVVTQGGDEVREKVR